MPENAVETKPEGAENVQSPAPDATKPEGAVAAGGGETTPATAAPSQEPDWKAQFADLKSKYDAISTQVPSLVKGMNEAQQRAAFYEKQSQALVGIQPKQEDPVEALGREAEELEAAYRFAEAAPIRSRISVEMARRAAREEWQNQQRQSQVQSTQSNVARILKDRYGIDPSLANELGQRATSSPEAIAQALATVHDPELVTKVALREADERKKASERALLNNSFGGGSGGRGIPGNGTNQKPRMAYITYSALPASRKDEIKSMAREGKIDLYTVTGKGAGERVETIDPRDL